MDRHVKENMYSKLATKYGMTVEQAKANCRNIEETAKVEGLHLHFEKVILTNTFDAHRLVMFSKQSGLEKKMTDRLLKAYYSEGRHLGDHSTLIELSCEVGLETKAVAEMLSTNMMEAEVRQDETKAAEYGIKSIPFFLIENKYAITGAQPTEVFVDTLNQIQIEDGHTSAKKGKSCEDGGCDI